MLRSLHQPPPMGAAAQLHHAHSVPLRKKSFPATNKSFLVVLLLLASAAYLSVRFHEAPSRAVPKVPTASEVETISDLLLSLPSSDEVVLNRPRGASMRSSVTLPDGWPSGQAGRRRRRFEHKDHVGDLATLNALGCPPHRSPSPHGFLPSPLPPIDSVITSTVTDVEAILRGIMSRFDDSNSKYFTTITPRETSYVTDGDASGGGEAPVQVDVVYTYVNGSAPSLRKGLDEINKEYSSHRFADWNELLYSLRTVFYGGMCHRMYDNGTCDDNASDIPFVRNIYIVVAERDQVPRWLDTSNAHIKIVTHQDIFPFVEDPITGKRTWPHLPTFNSHAIELQLHRIPGLLRFFIYFNNDMLWGRRVSLFDYFRPLSTKRAAHRGASTLLLEPIIYGEAITRSCQPMKREGQAEVLKGILTNEEQGGNLTCGSHPIRPSFLYSLGCFYRNRKEHDRDVMLRKIFRMQTAAFQRLDGLAVVHSFPHYPQLFDRRIVERMVEHDFEDIAEETRRSKVRTDRDLWITLLYSTYALAHRMAVDTAGEQGPNPVSVPMKGIDFGNPAEEIDETKESISTLGPNFFATDTWMKPRWQWDSELAPRHRQIALNLSWMNTDTVLTCARRTECTSVLREKLRRHVVFFFERLSSYRFCQVRGTADAVYCLKDAIRSTVGASTRLFWTLNDDWGTARGKLTKVQRANRDEAVDGEVEYRQKRTTIGRRRREVRRLMSTASDSSGGVTNKGDEAEASLDRIVAESALQRHRRRMKAMNDETPAPSDNVSVVPAQEYFSAIMRVITRDAAPAPWELPNVPTGEDNRDLRRKSDALMGGVGWIEKVISQRQAPMFEDPTDHLDCNGHLIREWRKDRRLRHSLWTTDLLGDK